MKNRLKNGIAILMSLTLGLGGIFVPGSASVSATSYNTYYVDPVNGDDTNTGINEISAFRTIKKARDTVRTVNSNMTSDITVFLRGGTYSVADTIDFTEVDSGTNGYNIIYKAYNGEKPVISGGTDLSGGWTLHDGTKNIYKKTGVTGNFRQLFINDKWGTRARIPNLTDDSTGGPYYSAPNTSHPYKVNVADIGSWALNGSCEMVTVNEFDQNRARIESYTTDSSYAYITFRAPEVNNPWNRFTQNPLNYYFENAYELLDIAGEWFLDTSNETLYYIPATGENINSDIIIAPSVEKIFNLAGTESSPVHNIMFSGITFKHGIWLQPSYSGYFARQAGIHTQVDVDNMYAPSPGMIDLSYSNNIRIERNVFTLSGAWGVMENEGCSSNTYIGNYFNYLASGGICLGNLSQMGYLTVSNPPGTSANDVVSNNLFDRCGYYYMDAVPLIALKVTRTTITHNEVRNAPYTGISIGYEWDNSNNQQSEYNVISYNRVHHVMTLLADGGGIYTLGAMPNSEFSHNYIYNVMDSPYSGTAPSIAIYLDQGSTYKTVTKNVTGFSGLFTGGNFPYAGNIMVDNYYTNTAITNTGTTPFLARFENNINCLGTKYPQEAIDIMNAAGIEDEYADIGTVTRGTNIALQGTAIASSNASGASPSYAIDNGYYNAEIWASNSTEANPWWQLDLGRQCRISEISIEQVQNSNYINSRRNFTIEVSNDSSFSTYTTVATYDNIESTYNKGVSSALFDSDETYRYVRVRRINDAGFFLIAEVFVFGTPANHSSLTDYEARWSLDGNGNDSGIYGHDMTVSGGGFVDYNKTEGSFAYNSAGSGTASTTGVVSLKTDNFSMGGWIYWTGSTEKKLIFSNGYSGSYGYGIGINYDSIFYKPQIIVGGKGVMTASKTISTNQWVYIMIARRNGTWEMYINGEAVTLSSTGLVPGTPMGTTVIQSFPGVADDLRFYNYPLLASEIKSLVTSYKIAPTDYAAHWSLDNNGSDSSGNGYDFTISDGSFSGNNKVEGNFSFNSNGSGTGSTAVVSQQTDNITMGGWIYWSGGSEKKLIFANGYSGSSGFGIGLNYDNIYYRPQVVIGGKGILTSNRTISENQWMHIVVIRRNGTWEMYVNGETTTLSNSSLAPGTPIETTNIYSFMGMVDDAFLFNRPLSMIEVNALIHKTTEDKALKVKPLINFSESTATLQSYNMLNASATFTGLQNANNSFVDGIGYHGSKALKLQFKTGESYSEVQVDGLNSSNKQMTNWYNYQYLQFWVKNTVSTPIVLGKVTIKQSGYNSILRITGSVTKLEKGTDSWTSLALSPEKDNASFGTIKIPGNFEGLIRIDLSGFADGSTVYNSSISMTGFNFWYYMSSANSQTVYMDDIAIVGNGIMADQISVAASVDESEYVSVVKNAVNNLKVRPIINFDESATTLQAYNMLDTNGNVTGLISGNNTTQIVGTSVFSGTKSAGMLFTIDGWANMPSYTEVKVSGINSSNKVVSDWTGAKYLQFWIENTSTRYIPLDNITISQTGMNSHLRYGSKVYFKASGSDEWVSSASVDEKDNYLKNYPFDYGSVLIPKGFKGFVRINLTDFAYGTSVSTFDNSIPVTGFDFWYFMDIRNVRQIFNLQMHMDDTALVGESLSTDSACAALTVPEETYLQSQLLLNTYIQSDSLIYNVDPDTTADTFVSKIKQVPYGKTAALKKSGATLAGTELVTTGTKFILSSAYREKEYTILIYGDINKDGQKNSNDLIELKNSLLGRKTFDGISQKAAKKSLSDNSALSITDLLALKDNIIG